MNQLAQATRDSIGKPWPLRGKGTQKEPHQSLPDHFLEIKMLTRNLFSF